VEGATVEGVLAIQNLLIRYPSEQEISYPNIKGDIRGGDRKKNGGPIDWLPKGAILSRDGKSALSITLGGPGDGGNIWNSAGRERQKREMSF